MVGDERAEALAGALWNIHEGYSVADNQAIGKGPLDWIGPDDAHPDDVKQRALFLGHAEAVIEQLRLAGWEFRRAR